MTDDIEKQWIDAATKIPRILLVDDDPLIVETICAFAKQFHMILDAAMDGETALEFDRQFDYLAILLDLRLPRISGQDVFRQIRLKNRDIPIGVISGGIPLATSEELLHYGRFTHLPKPFQAGLRDLRGWLLALGVKPVSAV